MPASGLRRCGPHTDEAIRLYRDHLRAHPELVEHHRVLTGTATYVDGDYVVVYMPGWRSVHSVLVDAVVPADQVAPVLDANCKPVSVPADLKVTDALRGLMSCRVPADCGHYLPSSEYAIGLRYCQQC